MSRDAGLDNIKGIMIFLVVFGHFVAKARWIDGFEFIYSIIYALHMPTFTFIAGIFTHDQLDIERAQNLTKTLIIPFLIFELLHYGCDLILTGHFSRAIFLFNPRFSMWFLLSLIFWHITLPIIKTIRFPVLFTILLAVLGLFSESTGKYLSIARTLTYAPFFIMGNVYGNLLIDHIKHRINIYYIMIAIACLLCVALFAQYIPKSLLMGSSSFFAMKISPLQGITQRTILWIISFFGIVSVIILFIKYNWLQNWGKGSLIIYLWQSILMRLIWPTYNKEWMIGHSTAVYFIFIIISISVCYIFSLRKLITFHRNLFSFAFNLISKGNFSLTK